MWRVLVRQFGGRANRAGPPKFGADPDCSLYESLVEEYANPGKEYMPAGRYCRCDVLIWIKGSPSASDSFAKEAIVKFGKPRVQRVICVSLHPIFSASSLCVIPLRFRISAMLSMIARDQSISCLTAGDTISTCL